MRTVLALMPVLMELGCIGPCEQEPERRTETAYPTWDELAAALDGDGELTPAACEALCAKLPLYVATTHGCELATSSDSPDTAATPPAVTCDITGAPFCGGRRHAVLAAGPACRAPDRLGAWLARAAFDEACSVHAFLALIRELRAFGAPGELIARCAAAALDEVAHARTLGRLARVAGAVVARPTLRTAPKRGLLAFAIENAVEGCVHETFAAVVAGYQSMHADDALRAVYAQIAADEVEHAELAWAIDAWLATRLDAVDRARVEAARAGAITRLFASVDAPGPEPVRAVGAPDAGASRRLLDGLSARVWHAS